MKTKLFTLILALVASINMTFAAITVQTAPLGITAIAGDVSSFSADIKAAAPDAAPSVPKLPKKQVKAVYSATYNADCDFAEWGSGTVYTQEEFGKKYVTTDLGYFGLLFEGDNALNCTKMEKLHLDIWVAADTAAYVVPLRKVGGREKGVWASLKGQQWNAIDINLTEYDNITDWSDIYSIKFELIREQTLWVNNVYFYTTVVPPVDNDAPTDVTAIVGDASFFSAEIKAKATDAWDDVIFTVKNGENVVAIKNAKSGVEAVITVKGLRPNTEYNLSVIASDEDENASEPVAVTVKTAEAPAAAPAPEFDAAKVLSIYSDAYTFAPASLNSYNEDWWEAPAMTEGELVNGNKALYYAPKETGMIGWQFGEINATKFQLLNVDIYPIDNGQITIYPVNNSDPKGEYKKTVNVKGGEWNHVVIDLRGNDLTKIIQIGWIDYYELNGFFIDNVFFAEGHSIILQCDNTMGHISGEGLFVSTSSCTIEATPNYGYHFTQWNDGNTDNPRTIILTKDTTFTAEFAKNEYTITVASSNNEWGSTSGCKKALYLDEVEISAMPNYGYRFVQWEDTTYVCDEEWEDYCWEGHWEYFTSPTRTITVTQDTTFTATFAKNVYSITKVADSNQGSISGDSQAEYLDNVTLEAIPNYGYHFTQWSDGVKDNPRSFEITRDTSFCAEFAKNEYTITTAASNSEWGSTAGDTKALYLDEVKISATPNYGYHFVQWEDTMYVCDYGWDDYCWEGHWEYFTSPTRAITVTQDTTFIATFAKNVYSITKVTNSNQGVISGSSQAEYLDYVTLEAVPNYGYHFTQWSDGVKDNPRIVQLTKDTTFAAGFALDRTGTCGKDFALVWSYDPVAKVLTIGNAGAFTENMRFGIEAPGEMEELVIGHNVTSIGDRAFSGIEKLKKVSIGESVKTIGEQAFYNCVNLETIYNYRPTPTNAYSTAFDGVDKFECALYVLPNSIDMYKNASVWRDFYYTYAIGASETTVANEEVTVTPAVTTATVTWPVVENAATYELVIKDKSGNVVCTLVFNSNGQLTEIAFAAPGRSQASTQATGFSFTITGLDSGTGYDLTINAKDSQGEVINTTTQSFTTVSNVTTGVDATLNASPVRKQLIDGVLYILRDGKTYTVQGQEVR